MRYVILNWMDTMELMDIGLCMKETGEIEIFDTEKEAKEYTKDLNGECRIIKID